MTAERSNVRKVLYSPGFGAGWTTNWNAGHAGNAKALTMDPELIAMVEQGSHLHDGEASEAFQARAQTITGDDSLYFGGVKQLEVAEVDGPFHITEYDGAESIELAADVEWL